MASSKESPDNKLSKPTPITIGKPGGLHARIAQAEMVKEIVGETSNPTTMPNRIALMLDCSGSMDGEKMDLLKKAAQSFIQDADLTSTSLAIEAFGMYLRQSLTTDRMTLWSACFGLAADGGTPLHEAMRVCIEYPLTRAIIISDGDANTDCETETENFVYKKIPVDCVHIGNSTGGEALLQRIASKTGGLFIKFKDVSQFASAFRFLLPEYRADAKRLMLTAGANEVK